jgi:hypothetical protein
VKNLRQVNFRAFAVVSSAEKGAATRRPPRLRPAGVSPNRDRRDSFHQNFRECNCSTTRALIFSDELSKRNECIHPFRNFQRNRQHAMDATTIHETKDRLDALQLLPPCGLSTPQMLWRAGRYIFYGGVAES